MYLTASVFSQTVQLIVTEATSTDTLEVLPETIDSLLNSRLITYTNKGYWDARIELVEVASESIRAHISSGDISDISRAHFLGVPEKDSQYLEKEFKMGLSSIEAAKVEIARIRLNGLGYQLAETTQLSRDQENNFHLTQTVMSHPELKVEGLASFKQSSDADTVAWYGQIRINIPNFDGRGKSFDFLWERLKENSEYFKIGLTYPWLFQLPLKMGLNFSREVVEGNYQIIQSAFELGWDLDWERSLYFTLERDESIITHEGALQYPDWKADKKQLLGLGFRQSSLNKQQHQGIALKTTLYQEINFEPQSIRKFTMRSEAEMAFPWGIYFSQRVAAIIQNHTIAHSDPSILMPLGGVNSVRGFAESEIRAPNILNFQNTIHYAIGNQSELLIFYDVGIHNTESTIHNLQGYGGGVQLRSGRGPIRLILASHRGLNLSNSYFHIEYSGGLSWIDR